jgi:hypothetical protein
MHRRLVSCGLVSPVIMKVSASDGTVWLHRVELDETGQPISRQIDRLMNLIWVTPGMDAVLNDTAATQRN